MCNTLFSSMHKVFKRIKCIKCFHMQIFIDCRTTGAGAGNQKKNMKNV